MSTIYVHTVTVCMIMGNDGYISTASLIASFSSTDKSEDLLVSEDDPGELKAFFAAKDIVEEAQKHCLARVRENGGTPVMAPVVVFLEVNESPDHPKEGSSPAGNEALVASDDGSKGVYPSSLRFA